MKTQFNIQDLIRKGQIGNELELERALIADRKLKLLSKKDASYKATRQKLRDIIASYEAKNWSEKSIIDNTKIHESDIAELIAEKERLFIEKRKTEIKKKLKSLSLTQQELGVILGHSSKSYMSELMNGISPFTLKDLIIINRILRIELSILIPTILPHKDRLQIKNSISKLNNDKLKLTEKDFEYA